MGSSESSMIQILEASGRSDLPLVERPSTIACFLDNKNGLFGCLTKTRLELLSVIDGGLVHAVTFDETPVGKKGFALYGIFVSLKGAPIFLVAFSSNEVRGYTIPTLNVQYQLDIKPAEVQEQISSNSKGTIVNNWNVSSLCCPLNNAIFVGLENGLTLSYFLSTGGELAATFVPPIESFQRMNIQSEGKQDKNLESENRQMMSAVTAIGFCPSLNLVMTGHSLWIEDDHHCHECEEDEFSETEEDGHTVDALESVPVVIFDLNRNKIVGTLSVESGVKCICPLTTITKNRNKTQIVVITEHTVRVYSLTMETPVKASISRTLYSPLDSLLLGKDLSSESTETTDLESAAKCTNAVFDSESSVGVLSIEGAGVAAIKIRLEEVDTSKSEFDNTREERQEVPRCDLVRFLEVRDKSDPRTLAYLSLSQWEIHSLWVDAKEDVALIGDGVSRLKLCQDLLGEKASNAVASSFQSTLSSLSRKLMPNSYPATTKAQFRTPTSSKNVFLVGGTGGLPSERSKNDLPILSFSMSPHRLPSANRLPEVAAQGEMQHKDVEWKTSLPYFSFNPSASLKRREKELSKRKEIALPGQE
eukprot:GHVP01000627.1.p1 GENE.GHVP01000627.1~~GHVP01000627.1.p1  ORF type:complete len:589 (+),score=118.21 GHVP01000627.1:767-2533(+)